MENTSSVISNKVVVVGRNYCNILTTARALGEANYQVEVVKVFKTKPSALKFLRTMKPDAYSKYVVEYNEIITNNDENVVADFIINHWAGERRLVIPVDDYVCSALDKNLDKLDGFVIPNINGANGGVVALMDKNEQKRRAESFRLPMVHSCLIKSTNGEYSVPDDVRYPCFIKPNVSMLSTKSTMKKCEDSTELNRALSKYAANGDFEMLCEEFIDIKDEYSILGVSTGDKVLSAGIMRVVEGGNRDRKGVALIGELVDAKPFEDIIKKCNDYISGIGYVGLFDIDLIENTDGKVYFVELNFRAGASTYALNSVGINLFGMFADYVIKGQPINDSVVAASSKRFVSEKVLMEEFARGDASLSKVKKCMKDADVFFVKNELDEKPYKYFKKFYLPSMAIRLMYKFR